MGLALWLLALCLAQAARFPSTPTPPPPPPGTIAEDDAISLITSLSNWGRWGPQDGLGLMNLQNATTRMKALALVRSATPISLSRPVVFGNNKAAFPMPATRLFIEQGQGRTVNQSMLTPNTRGNFNMEFVSFAFHGFGMTHMDTPAHVIWNDRLYNNVPSSAVDSTNGATAFPVTNLPDGVFARAFLIDIPQVFGIPWLNPLRQWITQDMISTAIAKCNITVQPGDIMLLRTGFWAYSLASNGGDVDPEETGCPGLHPNVMKFIHAQDISMIGTDTPGDLQPVAYEHLDFPMHIIGIRAMGLWILDNGDFERISVFCAKTGRYTFAIQFAPLMFQGGTGSPINPIALL